MVWMVCMVCIHWLRKKLCEFGKTIFEKTFLLDFGRPPVLRPRGFTLPAWHAMICRAQNIEIWEGLPWFWLGQEVFWSLLYVVIVPHNRNLWEDLGSGVRRWMVSRRRRSRQTTCFSYGKLMLTACSRSSRWWLSLGKNLDGLNVGHCPWIKCDIDEERSTAAWNY